MARFVRAESALWETTSLLLIHDGEAVLVDPGVSAREVEALRDLAEREDTRVVAALVTHADWDHVAGLHAFTTAEVAMGMASLERVLEGSPAAALAREADRLRLGRVGAPHCDRVLEPGRAARIGPFVVETVALAGHTADGTGYRVPELDLLIVGDHLSPVEFPSVYHSTAAYRQTLAGLVEMLRREPPAQVAPGHGRLLAAGEALAVAEADLAYLNELRACVARVVRAGGDAAQALEAGMAVEPPRPGWDDDEVRRLNAERQLEELLP